MDSRSNGVDECFLLPQADFGGAGVQESGGTDGDSQPGRTRTAGGAAGLGLHAGGVASAVLRPGVARGGRGVSALGMEKTIYGVRGQIGRDGGRGGSSGDSKRFYSGAGAGVGESRIAAGSGVERADAGGEGSREKEGL